MKKGLLKILGIATPLILGLTLVAFATIFNISQGGTGSGTANGALNNLLPVQTGNSGKYLTTNGTNTSWGTVSAGGVSSFNTRTGAVTLTTGDVTGALGFTPYNATNPAGYGTGTVTNASIVSANGISGTVATSTTTPAITLSLGAITPSSVNGISLTTGGSATTFLNGAGTYTTPAGTTYTGGTGLTLTGGAFSVNTSQNIATLSNLTSNGLIKTTGGTGALSIATAGTDYLASVNANSSLSGSGTTASALGLNLGNTNTWTALQTLNTSAIATTSTDGLLVQNTTASTAGVPVQYSPRIRLQGSAWNTGSLISESANWIIENDPISVTNPNTSTLIFGSNINGGAYTNSMTVSNGGTVTASNWSGNGSIASLGGNPQTGNFYVSSSASSLSTTVSSFLIGSAGTVNYKTITAGSSVSPAVASSYGGIIFGRIAAVAPASGTNAIFANVAVTPIAVTTGGATVTNAASLYVDGPATGASNNWSLDIASGNTNLGGTLTTSGLGTFTSGINVPTGQAYQLNSVNMIRAQTSLFNYYFGSSGNLTATGQYNTSLGNNALVALAGGSSNLGIGLGSLGSTTSGSYNVAVGVNAVGNNVTGSDNVGIGNNALVGVSTDSLSNDVGIGFNSGFGLTTGSNDVFLGPSAGYNITSTSNIFLLNSTQQSSSANDLAYSLLYGTFSGVAGSLTGQQLTVNGTLNVNGTIKNTSTQQVVSCSTSGNVTFSEPEQGSSYKQVIAYSAACLGTASYTFPTAFTNTPDFIGADAAKFTSISTTATTFTGTTTTGFAQLYGY